MKICRVQRCNVERVKKKEFKTFLLHCWNCTFAPPNFLNLFFGSVWLWKFAGCKGTMLKGEKKNLKLFFYIVGIAPLHLRIFLIYFLGLCVCESLQGAKVQCWKDCIIFVPNCWNCSFALLNFLNLFWILDPCDCENRQGGPRNENRKVKVESGE